MIQNKPNANFHSLGGTSVHNNTLNKYQEYRRCWMEYPSKFILRDFPMHLDIEITNRCNLKCTFCDRQPFLKKDEIGDMDLSLYKRIIDEGTQHTLWAVKLSYRGEPLLHKNIVEMVSYAKKKGILDIFFNTNAMLLDERKAEELINAGLNRISFSVEGTDPSVYEKMRINAKFDVVLSHIESLIGMRKNKGIDHPKIRVQSINFPGFDIEDYKNFWSSRSDEVGMLDFTDIAERETGLVSNWACPQLWQRMTIEWDGTVFPCNNDDLRLLTLGNVKNRTIYECWHDKEVEKVRALHRKGESHKVKACDGCSWRTAQIKKIG